MSALRFNVGDRVVYENQGRFDPKSGKRGFERHGTVDYVGSGMIWVIYDEPFFSNGTRISTVIDGLDWSCLSHEIRCPMEKRNAV